MKNDNEKKTTNATDFARIQLQVEQRAVEEQKEKKKKLLVIGIPVTIFVVFYLAMTIFYATHFHRNSTINGVSVSNMTVKEAAETLESANTDYTLVIRGKNPKNAKQNMVLGEITGKDIALNVRDYNTIAKNYFGKQFAPVWFLSYFGMKHDYDTRTGTSYEEERVENILHTWEAFDPEQIVVSESAYISSYDEEKNSFTIRPAVIGTEINEERTIARIHKAIVAGETELDLDGTVSYYVKPERETDNVKLVKSTEIANRWLACSFVYNWNGNAVLVNKDVIKDWVTFDNFTPVLDREAVKIYVRRTAAANDGNGKKTDIDAQTRDIVVSILKGEISDTKKAVKSRDN